jgi:hypothetical protein
MDVSSVTRTGKKLHIGSSRVVSGQKFPQERPQRPWKRAAAVKCLPSE